MTMIMIKMMWFDDNDVYDDLGKGDVEHDDADHI